MPPKFPGPVGAPPTPGTEPMFGMLVPTPGTAPPGYPPQAPVPIPPMLIAMPVPWPMPVGAAGLTPSPLQLPAPPEPSPALPNGSKLGVVAGAPPVPAAEANGSKPFPRPEDGADGVGLSSNPPPSRSLPAGGGGATGATGAAAFAGAGGAFDGPISNDSKSCGSACVCTGAATGAWAPKACSDSAWASFLASYSFLRADSTRCINFFATVSWVSHWSKERPSSARSGMIKGRIRSAVTLCPRFLLMAS
mmetsp:Transcript_37943/g.90753  ORF Transcript_37943/g.90753 Transcript_37943/m.90753 type:complete len:249 (-) Transcript_37943:103-849(-)